MFIGGVRRIVLYTIYRSRYRISRDISLRLSSCEARHPTARSLDKPSLASVAPLSVADALANDTSFQDEIGDFMSSIFESAIVDLLHRQVAMNVTYQRPSQMVTYPPFSISRAIPL